MDLTDLTIIITSRNRPEKLTRVVNYLESVGFNGKLLIGDASDENFSYPFKVILKRSHLNIDYFPQEGMSVVDSHQYLCTRISTQYSLCIADGALVLLDGIKECIRELERNKELVAVSGQTFTYENKNKTNFRICHYEMPIICNSKPIDRLKNLSNKYRVAMYCVMHSRSWIKMWHGVDKIGIGILAAEIIPSVKLVIEGKIAQINSPYLIRELHSKRTCKEEVNLFLYDNFSEAYKTSVNIIHNEINLFQTNLSQEKIKDLFNNLIRLNKNNEIIKSSFPFNFRKIFTFLTSFDFINKMITNLKLRFYSKKFLWNNNKISNLKESIAYIRNYKE